MKMKKVSLLLLFAFVFVGISKAQLGTTTVTYDLGDIETDKNFNWYSGTQSSDCPGVMTVTIPTGATILSTDVSYDMTSVAPSNINRQRSHFRCVSPGGLHEAEMYQGGYDYNPGTKSYSRTGLDIANGVTGGGDIVYELHGGANHYVNYCSIDSIKIDNNTWTITITYIPAGYPEQAINPDPVDGGLYFGLDDDLIWDFGANTDSYDVYFGTENPPMTKVVDNLTAGASGTYDPGTLNTTETYYWKVVSRNANGYTDGPVWSFTTVCGPYATPFTEDFESVTTPELPYCWLGLVNSTSAYALVETNGYGGNNAPQCLKMQNSDDASAIVILVVPQIDLVTGSLADKMIQFSVKGYEYPNITVGTMSDPDDETTFTSYESILVWEDYIEHDVYLNNYTGTDSYVALKLDAAVAYSQAYVDDITIDDMPSCIRPEDLDANNLTINSATLSWTDLNGATSWNIEYDTAGFTPTGTPTITGVTNPYTLTGLNSGTWYEFYVQADCGSGDVSAWSQMGSFFTPCDFYAVPFIEDFEGLSYHELPLCWTEIVLCLDGFVMNGTQNGGYKWNNGNDLNSTLIFAGPPVEDLALNRLRFDAYTNNAGSEIIIGTMSDPSDQFTFDSLTTVIVNATMDYESFDVWMNGYTGTDNYFAFKHPNGMSHLQFTIDNIEVEALPTCLEPSNMFVSNVTNTSTIFNWTETGTATDWEIEIGALGFAPGTGAALSTYTHNNQSGTDQTIDLTGLTSGTAYDVYVRTDCGGGDYSPWTGPVAFMTSFDAFPSMYVSEDFESGMGITNNHYANLQDWAINTDLKVSGVNSIHNAYTEDNDNTLFLSGTLDFTAEADIMLTFWHIAKTNGNNDHCYVEISTDGGSTFDQLPESTYAGAGWYREEGLYNQAEGPCFDEDSYPEWGTSYETPDSTWWRKEYFNLTDYNTFDNVVIRFRIFSGGYGIKDGWYIDDIAIETLGTPAVNVSTSNLEGNTSPAMPVANLELLVGNTGSLPAGYNAAVIYDETDLFNADFNTGMPIDWTVVNNGTNTVTWTDTAQIWNKNFDGTSFAWVDAMQSNGAPVTNIMDEELISPAIDASSYASGSLQLEYYQVFDAQYNVEDTARVYVFDGTDWIMIYEAWTDDGSIYSGGAHKVWDVSAYANDNFQVKFHYIEGSITGRGRYFALDNVRLRASMSALDWLTVDGLVATEGNVFPDADGIPSIIDVNMDGTGLATGTYMADIEVTSTDPGFTTTLIPVTLNVVAGSTISGTMTYANTGMSILEGCTVDLLNDNSEVIFTTNTDATGYYEFTGIVDGDYTLETSTTIAWGGLSMNDVQFARQYVVNQPPGNTLSGLQLLSADVDQTGGAISMNDIQFMRQVVTASPPGFAPFWVFENPDVIVSGGNITVDYQGICAGDTDGSYTPPAK